MAREKHRFKISASIIRHLIESQAGSIEKAILETVMNGIDAGARTLSIRFTDTETIVIEDNGRGFATREEVEKHFGVFGFDHESKEERAMDRKLGRFGLGRGQIMAFAATVWETNEFRMHVDIRDSELVFELEEGQREPVQGCRITARLYEPMSRLGRRRIRDEVSHQVRFAPIKVTIDSKRVSLDPEAQKWSVTTEELWFSEKPNSHLGVEVYNLGIYVRTYPHYIVGISGVLVSRPGNVFKVNTARNDVLQSRCALWKKAKRILESETGRRRTKTQLHDEDRISIIHQLMAGEACARDYERTALFKTVSGRYMSAYTVSTYNEGIITLAPTKNSQVGERIHREKMAAVLAPENAEWLDVQNVGEMGTRLNQLFAGNYPISRTGYTGTEFEKIKGTFSETYEIVAGEDWTTIERAAVAGLQQMSRCVSQQMSPGYQVGEPLEKKQRNMKIGICGAALAWTDGKGYIAIERGFLATQLKRGLDGWTTLLNTVIHEYIHEEPNTGDHAHGPDFYEAFHGFMTSEHYYGLWIVMRAVESYNRTRKKEGLKMTRMMEQELDRIDEARTALG